MYDCIIIGAGHNGLVCANYLARAGWKILVVERRDVIGGCCVTEELWPGYRVSTAAYVVSLLLPEIEQELELAKYGYQVLPRDPSSFTPFEDGRYLVLGPDVDLTCREISKFSNRDALAYPQYEALLSKIAECLEPAMSQTPPDPLPLPGSWRKRPISKRLRDGKRALDLLGLLKGLGEDLPEAIELPDHPWFVGVQFHPELKSKPFEPHPLFASFIGAALEQSRLV